MLSKFELVHNVSETIKRIFCVKSEGTVDHNAETWWFKKFHLGCKILDDQVRSGGPKTVVSEAVLRAIEVNSESINLAQHLTVQCVLSPSQSLQIQWVAHEEYLVISEYDSPVCFITFTTSANPVTSTLRVSGDLSIWQSSVFHHLHNPRQIQWVAQEEYQVISAYDSPVCFITFTSSEKASGTAELCLTLSKFCTTFDPHSYFHVE